MIAAGAGPAAQRGWVVKRKAAKATGPTAPTATVIGRNRQGSFNEMNSSALIPAGGCERPVRSIPVMLAATAHRRPQLRGRCLVERCGANGCEYMTGGTAVIGAACRSR
jgi:hypothetical protein